MANHFPVMNVIKLRYSINTAQHTVGLMSTIAGTINLAEYDFANAGNYATFDQDAAELMIVGALNASAVTWAAELGIAQHLVQAGLTVNRLWVFAGPDFVSSQILYSDTMTYPALPTLSNAACPAGVHDTPYFNDLNSNGGTLPITWSISAGTLPAGMAIDPPSGALYGTPTTAGTSSFTVEVTDQASNTATQALSIVVS